MDKFFNVPAHGAVHQDQGQFWDPELYSDCHIGARGRGDVGGGGSPVVVGGVPSSPIVRVGGRKTSPSEQWIAVVGGVG